MSRSGVALVTFGGLIAAAVVIAVIVFGVIGINQTVRSGTQQTVCGVKFGVSVSEQKVRLLGISDKTLSPGDRVRASSLCVIEIVDIEDDGIAAAGAASSAGQSGVQDQDGVGARVQLRWRFW